MTAPVSVRGGSGGVAADADRLRDLARTFGDTATGGLDSARRLHAVLFDPQLALSLFIDPEGGARSAAALADALDAPGGLVAASAHAGVLDGELRVAATAYAQTEHAVSQLALDARAAGGLPVAFVAGATDFARTGQAGAALQRALTTDPDALELTLDQLRLPATAGGAAGVMPDGHAAVRALGVDRAGSAGTAPRDLADVVDELDHRNDAAGAHHGEIDVRILRGADGERRVIVDVTGTRTWTPMPTSDITSLVTNGRALAGEATSYERGVLAAMARAGVRRTDDVMIVGHSEGGAVAVTTARDAVRSGRFDVTHVVTAGSPIGRSVGSVPGRVQVLALENDSDVVPRLDGRANPDRVNVTTVGGRYGDGTVGDDHSLHDGYEPLARDADASADRSVRDFIDGADGFFGATSVETHAYQVSRRY